MNTTELEDTNPCVICGVDMGANNPRQLCRKTYCENEKDEVMERCSLQKDLEGMIEKGEICVEYFLAPTLNIKDEEVSNNILDNLMKTCDVDHIEQHGSSSWGKTRHMFYHHKKGEFYTFYLSGFMGDVQKPYGLKRVYMK